MARRRVRDLVDSARHLSDAFSGPFRLGVIPSIAPYLLPQLLPLIRGRHPDLDLHLRETQTQRLLEELGDGDLGSRAAGFARGTSRRRDAVAVPRSLPAGRARVALHRQNVRATPDLLREDRLLLLEEGHCLRDQALAFCHLRQVESIDAFGVSGLSTIVQMVSNDLDLRCCPNSASSWKQSAPTSA